MDISSKDFVVHAINEKKKVVFKGSISPSKKGIRDLIAKLGLETKLFVFEAGNQMKWMADYFKKLGEDIHIVHPNEVKWIAESGGRKTDQIDARKLSELARADMLPRRVYVAQGDARTLRELTTAREMLVRRRVSLISSLRGYLKQENIKLPAKFFQSKDWQENLIQLNLSKACESIVASFMHSIEALKSSEESINTEIMTIKNKDIELLETIPGIGKLTARILFGAIADIERFNGSKALASYGALAPTIYQSGDELRMGPVSRSGRKEMRRSLLQCAHAVARMKAASAKPLLDFFHRVERKRGKKRALIALSRKLLTVVYAVLKGEEPYVPGLVRAA
jgi:transposase